VKGDHIWRGPDTGTERKDPRNSGGRVSHHGYLTGRRVLFAEPLLQTPWGGNVDSCTSICVGFLLSTDELKGVNMELNKNAFGLAAGILWGAAVLICTVWVLIVGGGEHLGLLHTFYFGYSVSPLGAVVGLIWGFVDGFIGGWLFAWLYNRLSARSS